MNMRDFDRACELLPEGVTWGEAITPTIVKHIAKAAQAQAQQPKDSVGNWLWSQLMDYVKSRGMSPTVHDDLFKIVDRARQQFDSPAQAKRIAELEQQNQIYRSAMLDQMFANGAQIEGAASNSQIAKQAERYEKLRKLNAHQFNELYWKNIHEGINFDFLVDTIGKDE